MSAMLQKHVVVAISQTYTQHNGSCTHTVIDIPDIMPVELDPHHTDEEKSFIYLVSEGYCTQYPSETRCN